MEFKGCVNLLSKSIHGTFWFLGREIGIIVHSSLKLGRCPKLLEVQMLRQHCLVFEGVGSLFQLFMRILMLEVKVSHFG